MSLLAVNTVAGNPARIIGNIDDFVKRTVKLDVDSKGMSYEDEKAFLLSLSEDEFIRK